MTSVTLLLLTFSFNASGEKPSSIFDEVTQARECAPSSADVRQVNCRFKVRDLDFEIAGVGAADAGVVFYKSDYDGDFYAGVGRAHDCVLVKPGAKNKSPIFEMVFVSVVDGRVYRSIHECRSAK